MITSLHGILASQQRVFEYLRLLATGSLRNDFPGFVGGTVRPRKDMTVTHLGRYVNSGNTQSHLLTLWNATDSQLVAQATVNCAGRPTGFEYTALSSTVNLQGDKTYYLTSEEFAGGDLWQNFNSSVSPTGDFSAASSLYSASPIGGFTIDVPNAVYVPVNLKYYSATPDPTPDVLWWKMRDGSGGTVTATVGTNGATNASWVAGENGNGFSLEFNGTSSTASTNSAVTIGTSVATFCFWVYFDDVTATRMVLEAGTSWDHTGGYIVYTNGGSLVFGIHGPAGNTQRSFVVSTGVWTHIAVVLDMSTAAGSITAYKNGVLTATSPVVTGFTGPQTVSTDALYVMNRAGTSLFHDGKIDDLRIYSRALSAEEVAAVYANPK